MEEKVMEKEVSRRNFFASAGMLLSGAVVSAAGCSMLKSAPVAEQPVAAWPYPYKKVDPELVRKLAHKGYYKGK